VTVLDKVTKGVGRITPQSNNRTVQHFEGGILAEIHVKDGDHVEEGALLFRLDNSMARASAETLQLQLAALRRLRLGRISLAGLPVGEWRYLLPYERF
jgi:multidrug efflux pump subunit AcrA (membrane-fusion protein)